MAEDARCGSSRVPGSPHRGRDRRDVRRYPPDVEHPPEAILLRVFVHFYGNRIVLLVAGYDKSADSSAKR